MTDPVSDMLIRIKNAYTAGHEVTRVSYSKYKHEIAKTLERGGLVSVVERKGKRTRRVLEIGMMMKAGKPMMQHVKLLSVPSRRLYTPYRDISVSGRGGMVLISTPKGVLSGKEARREKVGGQLIAEVW